MTRIANTLNTLYTKDDGGPRTNKWHTTRGVLTKIHRWADIYACYLGVVRHDLLKNWTSGLSSLL